VMADLTDGDDHGNDPVLIPRSSRVSDDAWRVSTPATVGDDCRLHGNIRATSLSVGTDNEIFGSLRAREDVHIDSGTEITGNVTTRDGTVHVAAGARIRGDVSGHDVRLHEDAVVEGSIRARGETMLVRDDDLADDRDADAVPETDGETDESDAEDEDEASSTDANTDEDDADDEMTADDVDDETTADDADDADDETADTVPDDESEPDREERVTASEDDYRENGHEGPVEPGSQA
jgi:cytoskeletal protein CcmA (bactofilin family)